MIKVDENDPVGELEPTFPYRDVTIKRGVDMKEYYDLEGEIGRGKFGTVYKCREKGTNLTLAAKFVGIARRQDRKNVEREVEIMKTLQHPRLIQLYDAFETDNVMCVVLELIEGGELFERVIDDDFILTEKACTVFMRQICEGVAFIHSHNIIHLDLKPENILCLTKTGNRIKIIDFGLARKFEPDKKLQVLFGTPEFVAPEVVNFDQISCATDMWSVGVICYVLLSGLSPFMGETDVETMANVTIARYDFEDESFDEISTEAKDFISRLLMKDKEARLTAVECLSHPWLRRQIPPPPPALDTTKDNLRNYVEKCVPLIHNPIIIDKEFHDKPGLIEKIIENEQKVIHPRSLTSNERNEIQILPTLNEHRPDPIFHNPTKSRFKIDNHPCINEKESLPNILENKGFQKAEVIDENNKNIARLNKIPINQQPNEIIFDNLAKAREMNNSNSQNVLKITGMVPPMEGINNDKSIDVKPVPAMNNIISFNESPIDKNDNSLQVSKIVPLNENNLIQLPGKTIDNKNTEQKINKLPLENNPNEKGNVDSTITEMKQYPPKTSKIFAEKLPVIEEKEVKGESPQFQVKRPATNLHLMANKPKIVEPIAVPSISTAQITNDSSNFSLHNLKYDNTFNKKPEKSFISDYIKNTENKNVSSERITPSLAFNESLMKEVGPVKENPLVFKQHLRSTPPWFSELKNEDSRKTTSTTSTRFDRRSSDFSCFLNSKEDTESLNLADEIRKLSARLLQMSGNQPNPQNQPLGAYNANSVQPRVRNDPITCFLENHGITHPRPKFKFSSLNRDVPIGSPPPPSNLAYYLNMASKTERKDSHSAPQSPRSSPEKNCGTENSNASHSNIASDIFIKKGKSQHISQEKTSSSIILDHVQINKTNKKLNFPV